MACKALETVTVIKGYPNQIDSTRLECIHFHAADIMLIRITIDIGPSCTLKRINSYRWASRFPWGAGPHRPPHFADGSAVCDGKRGNSPVSWEQASQTSSDKYHRSLFYGKCVPTLINHLSSHLDISQSKSNSVVRAAALCSAQVCKPHNCSRYECD